MEPRGKAPLRGLGVIPVPVLGTRWRLHPERGSPPDPVGRGPSRGLRSRRVTVSAWQMDRREATPSVPATTGKWPPLNNGPAWDGVSGGRGEPREPPGDCSVVPQGLVSSRHRLIMCQLAVQNSDWIR